MLFPILLTMSWPYPAARPGHPESRLACKPAFSLVELMIVLAIMALIAGIVVPNLQRNFDRNQVRDASRLFQEKIGELKMQASRTGQPVLVQFGWESNQLRIWNLPAANAVLSGTFSDSRITSNSSPNDPQLGSGSTESILSESSSESLWQSEDWVLPADVLFRSEPSDPDSPSNAGATEEESLATNPGVETPTDNENNSSLGSPQWSTPLVITGQGFSRDRLIWLETEKLQCPLLLRSVSGQIQTGRVRSIQSSDTKPALDAESSSEFSSDLEGSRS